MVISPRTTTTRLKRSKKRMAGMETNRVVRVMEMSNRNSMSVALVLVPPIQMKNLRKGKQKVAVDKTLNEHNEIRLSPLKLKRLNNVEVFLRVWYVGLMKLSHHPKLIGGVPLLPGFGNV
jgi:hypothetical protein